MMMNDESKRRHRGPFWCTVLQLSLKDWKETTKRLR